MRALTETDCDKIVAAFAVQGWEKPVSQYRLYCEEARLDKRSVVVAEYHNELAGYITVRWESDYPPFRAAGIPEISDLNVFIRFRRRGIGTALMDAAEDLIVPRSKFAGLGVGLQRDYGPAQALYGRRGYVPDGNGLSSRGRQPEYGETVTVDDNLCLYLTKRLR